jgi:hypothetical protein
MAARRAKGEAIQRGASSLPFENQFVSKIDDKLLQENGTVFYSGDEAFSLPSPIYILGVNPGGKAAHTIEFQVKNGGSEKLWSAYADQQWQSGKKGVGTAPMQVRIQHLAQELELDLRKTPASNLIFVTTPTENDLRGRFIELAERCWPFHQAVIDELGVRVVVCLSGKVGAYVRRKLGAHELRDTFVESNQRKWRSKWYSNNLGQSVVTLNHPSRVNWTAEASDPTRLVKRAVDDGISQ